MQTLFLDVILLMNCISQVVFFSGLAHLHSECPAHNANGGHFNKISHTA